MARLKKILRKLKPRKRRRSWFKSTPVVMIVIFMTSFLLALWIWGFKESMRMLVGYSLGISGVGIVVYFIFKVKGKKVFA